MYIVTRTSDEIIVSRLTPSPDAKPGKERIIAIPKTAYIETKSGIREASNVGNEDILRAVLPLIPKEEGRTM